MAEKCCTITSYHALRTPEGAKRPGGEPTCFGKWQWHRNKYKFLRIKKNTQRETKGKHFNIKDSNTLFLFWKKKKIIQQTHENPGLTFRSGVVVNFFICLGWKCSTPHCFSSFLKYFMKQYLLWKHYLLDSAFVWYEESYDCRLWKLSSTLILSG